MTAAQIAQMHDYYIVIRVGAVLATLLLLAMIRLPAALIIIALIWFVSWKVGAL